jgi:hypothetical protein
VPEINVFLLMCIFIFLASFVVIICLFCLFKFEKCFTLIFFEILFFEVLLDNLV